MVNRSVNQAETKQRFSLRKLKIGTVSVLLGATVGLMGVSGSANADTATATTPILTSSQDVPSQQTQAAVDLVQQDLGNNGKVQRDQAVTIDRTIHYQEQGTNKPLAPDAHQSISIVPYYQLGHVTVNYIDQKNGNILASKTLTGHRGSKVVYDPQDMITHYTDQGYVFVSSDYPQEQPTFTGTPQVFTILFKHATTPVTPDNPDAPWTVALYAATSADQDGDGLYYDLVQDNKIIARGLTKEQAWAKLAQIASPEIPGYRLVDQNQKVIDELIADAQANRHTVETVYYTRDQQPTPTPGEETPTTNPAGTPAKPGHQTATPLAGPVPVQTDRSTVVGVGTKQVASAAQLPQTGARAGRDSALGFGLVMFTALLSLLGIKKREY